jgi:hypothetical protein
MAVKIIQDRFRNNLERVRNLVEHYVKAAGSGKGRPSVHEADILRAAVVFLHATLEDLLRSSAEQLLPNASAETLSQIPFPGALHRRTTFNLGDLASFRGHGVDEIIANAVTAYLDKSTFNNPGDVKSLLAAMGLGTTWVDPLAARLAALMSRRHLIVHRADRNESIGSGHHRASSISRSAVEAWIDTVGRFGSDLLGRF